MESSFVLSFNLRMYPSQKNVACALVPKGQETEIMSLMSFFIQIIGWLPVVVFAVMNEKGVSLRWGVSVPAFFLAISFVCLVFCGNFGDAVEKVAHTSEIYLNEFSNKSGSNKVEGEKVEAVS